MIGFKQAVASAFIIGAAMGTTAFAQSTAAKTQVPTTVTGTPGPENTDSRNLDQNAQRAHGKDGAGVKDGQSAGLAAVNAATAPAEGSRYWEKYDANKDKLMEPTEVEAMLKDAQSSKPKTAG